MAQLTEPNVVGKRERLADLLTIVDAKMTPLYTRIRKSNDGPKNMQYSWLVDDYGTPTTNSVVDGTDVTTFENTGEARARIYNYAHNFRETAMVSTLTEEMTTVPTISSEIKYAAKKQLVKIKRDIECVLLGDQDAQADNGSVGYKTCGLDLYISTAGPSTFAVPSRYRPDTAQIDTTATASLTEASLQTILKAIFDKCGMDGDYMVIGGSTFRRKFTDMTRTDTVAAAAAVRVRNFTQSGSSTEVTDTVTIYNGDYGSLEVVSSSFIGWTGTAPDIDRAYVLNMSKLSAYHPIMPNTTPLPNSGGGPRIAITAVCGLQVDDGGKAHAKFKP